MLLWVKQTVAAHQPLSAWPPKAEIGRQFLNVRFGSLADILQRESHVRFSPRSGVGGLFHFKTRAMSAKGVTAIHDLCSPLSRLIGLVVLALIQPRAREKHDHFFLPSGPN